MLFEADGCDALGAFFDGGEVGEVVGEGLLEGEGEGVWRGGRGEREDGGVDGDGVGAFFEVD